VTRPFRNAPESAAPRLLVGFFAATLAMVLALVFLLRDESDWVDFVAIGLLIAVSALLLVVLDRQLGEQEPPEDDDPRRALTAAPVRHDAGDDRRRHAVPPRRP
jgi:hypothetical protein